MNKIIYNIELQPRKHNETIYEYYRKYTSQIKDNIDLIKLGLYCTKYCFEYNNKQTKLYTQKCIDLIESWLIDPNSVTKKELLNAASVSSAATNASYHRFTYYAWSVATNASWSAANINFSLLYAYVSNCLYYCSKIQNMNLPHQYLQTLLRSTKQFNIENPYSNHIKQIVKQDVDKLELVDYNMLLDISNEHYNIDLQEFNYDNIFSRRNLIETIRREYSNE